MRKSALTIIILATAILAVATVQAVGVSVTPKELKVSGNMGETVNAKLTVKNPSTEVSLFEIYPDELEKMIKPSPSSFILESGESREVTIQVTPNESGIFRTNISVLATPVAKASFNAGSGIKIPIEITTEINNSSFMALISDLISPRILGIMLLTLVLVLGFFVIKYGIRQIKI